MEDKNTGKDVLFYSSEDCAEYGKTGNVLNFLRIFCELGDRTESRTSMKSLIKCSKYQFMLKDDC